MADAPLFLNPDQLAYRLPELTAICVEFPAVLLNRLPESTSYLKTVIRELMRDKMLRIYYRDKLSGYRLSRKSKEFLLSQPP